MFPIVIYQGIIPVVNYLTFIELEQFSYDFTEKNRNYTSNT